MPTQDNIILSTGKKYAAGNIIGICLQGEDDNIYNGHDGIVGEFDGKLTIEEKKEIARIMINRWARFLGSLT